MEKQYFIELGLKEITRFPVTLKNEVRFISEDFGIVKALDDELKRMMLPGHPYRLVEGRIAQLRKGSIQLQLNLRTIRLDAPAILIVSPGSIGQILSFSPDADMRLLAFKNAFLSHPLQQSAIQMYLNGRLNVQLQVSQSQLDYIDHFYQLIWETLRTQGMQHELVRLLLQALLCHLSAMLQRQAQQETNQQSRKEQLFNRFLSLVNQYAKTERNVTFYADKLCLTPRYLNSIIRQISHRTVMDWVNDSVILEAKVMLKYEDKLVYQVADALNFPNVSFFCKFFKRKTGMTPLMYQRSK